MAGLQVVAAVMDPVVVVAVEIVAGANEGVVPAADAVVVFAAAAVAAGAVLGFGQTSENHSIVAADVVVSVEGAGYCSELAVVADAEQWGVGAEHCSIIDAESLVCFVALTLMLRRQLAAKSTCMDPAASAHSAARRLPHSDSAHC